MESNGCNSSSSMSSQSEEDMAMMNMELRRGPWTVEEDLTLINYIANHGEGRWNSLARCAGLKRTGKSCRLRWLNYLRPDVRRGNITLEEQLLILELHSRWGNRWSKIAQHLPGRTDNEIKNYWRTRVQKHAKQLKCDVNSKQFKDTMRYLWMPRLVERIQANAGVDQNVLNFDQSAAATSQKVHAGIDLTGYTPENSSPISDLTDQYNYNSAAASSSVPIVTSQNPNSDQFGYFQGCHDQAVDAYHPDRSTLTSAYSVDQSFADHHQGFVDLQAVDHHHHQQTNETNWSMDGLDQSDMGFWNGVDDSWFFQQHFNSGI